jgi:ABC-type Zn uptake system ZnuABC Zn-binding protein ZnuA
MKKIPRYIVRTIPVLSLLAFTVGRVEAQDRLVVVTTLPDLASITEFVGGDRVDVFAIATGFQNPHFVDPKPSYIRRLTRADMFVTVGLDLEVGWVPSLLTASRNSRIQVGGEGYVDASVEVSLLEQPTSTSREQGDIHIYGNPHYWLDPVRGKQIAANIAATLSRLRPSDTPYFESRLARFTAEIDSALATWMATISRYERAKVVAYHNEWPYFEARFGIDIVDFLEPRPGIPPTPSQLARIIRLMESENIRVIITSPYFRTDAADLVARKVDGVVVTLATSVGAEPGINTYFDLFRHNVTQLVTALEQMGYSTTSSR